MKQVEMFQRPESYPASPGWKAEGASKEAAIKIRPAAHTLRAKVLTFFVEKYPADYSADEVGRHLNLSPFCSRPRCTELAKQGLLEKTERRVTNESGFSASTWRASRQAMEAAR